MAAPLIHFNPAVFKDPLSFNPDRYIENPGLKRCLMPFSHGSRQCLGIQLAYAELYLVTYALWRRYGGKECSGASGWWELHKTDESDVAMASDRFIPYPKRDSTGIQVLVHKI